MNVKCFLHPASFWELSAHCVQDMYPLKTFMPSNIRLTVFSLQKFRIREEDLVEDFMGGEEKARSGQGLQPVFISTSQSMVQQRDHPLETLQTTGCSFQLHA